MRIEFGFHPHPLRLRAASITIEPLPGHAAAVEQLRSSEGIEQGWIYAPQQTSIRMEGGERALPYPSRVLGLPKTPAIEHTGADGLDHLHFHLWALSFFTGMRLTATDAGFVDATPIEPRKLVDFHLDDRGIERAIALAEAYWATHKATPRRARLWSAAVHALFLAQNPLSLQYEAFLSLYMALDACFALAQDLRSGHGSLGHGHRIDWLCRQFHMPVPAWADPSVGGQPEVTRLRNDTVHEALFAAAPLGFAAHRAGTSGTLTLEMQALLCRLLVALIGGDGDDYVRTSVGSRQIHGLELR